MHTLNVKGLPTNLRVLRFSLEEGISQLFSADITVASEERDLRFSDLLRRDALLTLGVGAEPRLVHGVASRVEQADEGKRLTAYRVTLVPHVARLKHTRTSRIFQSLTAPEIIAEVLRTAGVPSDAYRTALSGSYRAREHCVQYREADWTFLSRLMEEEGIAYFFEHSEAGHTLVLGDNPTVFAPIPAPAAVVFRPPTGALMKGEHIARFRYSERARPGRVTLRDYDWKRPSLSLEASAQGDIDVDLEVYDYPGEYDAPAAGSGAARVRLEELNAARRTGEGESVCGRLMPGFWLTLSEHPRDDLNQDYLITRVDHRGFDPEMDGAAPEGAATYENRFEVQPFAVAFRPPRVTPWPHVRGPQTAIVVGPPGEEIYTDAHGRVKVQFHWDREGASDDRSSCWIRVSQAWAGAAWGAMFIPRVGHEVVVDFLEGDPDRPIIIGSVYHGANVPPYPLPAERTKSTIKSESSPGGGGFNELRFDDRKGSEEIYLHGQKDWTIAVLNDKNQTIGRDETLDVGHNRDKTVKGNQSEAIGGEKVIAVAKGHAETIAGAMTVAVGQTLSLAVAEASTESIGGAKTVEVATVLKQSIGGSMSLAVAEGKVEAVGQSSAESVAGDKSVRVDGGYSVEVGKAMSVTIEGGYTEEVKKNRTAVVGEKLTLTADKEIVLRCGESSITLTRSGKILIRGAYVLASASGVNRIQGGSVQIN